MKILICTFTLSNGGAERVVSQWANGFVERGEDVQIVLLNGGTEGSTYYVDSRVNIIDVSSSRRNKVLNLIQTSYRLRKIIKKNHTEIVISALCPIQVWLATLLTKCVRINTEHNAFERPDGIIWKKDHFIKFHLNKVFDIVTVLSTRDLHLTEGKLRNVYHLPNPLAFASFYPDSKEKVILAVGRIDVWYCKGFDLLIQSWSRIFKNYSDWKLCIMGSGKDQSRDFLYNLAKDSGCEESILFQEFNEDIVEYYRKASIFILSSRYEGFGLVLIEAMSQGCSCVVCDYLGRQKEILGNDSCGVICSSNNVEELTKAMSKLLSNPQIRHTLSLNAYERSKEFALGKIMDIWYNIFAQAGINALGR